MRFTTRAFSLLEVVIAIAIFTSGVVVVLALMGNMAGRSTEATESVTALNLPTLIETSLRDETNDNFEAIRTFVGNGDALVANHGGDQIKRWSAGANDTEDAYFLIELTPLDSPEFAEVQSVMVPIAVNVSWPYKPLGASNPTSGEDRSSVSFNLAISR